MVHGGLVMKKFLLVALPVLLIAAATIGACSRRSAGGGQAQLLDIAQARGLSPEDAARAVKTFVAPGGRDEYLLFASGGHSGQVHVIGVPSMRLLKTIAVFTPEPWQGYGVNTAIVLSSRMDGDRKSTRLNSSHGYISYAVFCLKKKKKHKNR